MKIVFVSGQFNIIHPGHLRLLRFAKECGDKLVVAINSDLNSAPESINSDPYGTGWLFEVSVDSEPNNLLSAADYAAITA